MFILYMKQNIFLIQIIKKSFDNHIHRRKHWSLTKTVYWNLLLSAEAHFRNPLF